MLRPLRPLQRLHARSTRADSVVLSPTAWAVALRRSSVPWLFLALGVLAGCADDGPPFTRCAGAAECAAPSDGCYELRVTRSDGIEAVGRQCTLRCAGDEDCPAGGVCLVLEGDPNATPLCLATCGAPEDCFRGARCTDVDGPVDVMSVCLP